MATRLTTPLRGFDNTGQLSLGSMHANNFTYALRYLSRYTSKVITSSEAGFYKANGFGLGLVFEDEATRATRGYDVGVADAQFATAQATARLGFNPPVIYWAADWDATPGQTDGYSEGWTHVRGRAGHGPYGSYRLVKHHLDQGLEFAWQTYAWSYGALDPRAKLHQYLNTHSFDYDHAWYTNWGQVDAQPTPTPTPIPKDDDMPTTSYTLGAIRTVIAADKQGNLYQTWQEVTQPGLPWHGGEAGKHVASFELLATGKGPVASLSSSVAGGIAEIIVELQDGSYCDLWQHEDDRSWSGGEPGVRIAALRRFAPAIGS